MTRSILCNTTHRFGHQFDPAMITQDDIARCPNLDGVHLLDAVNKTPESISRMIGALPYRDDREHLWLYIRPQLCKVGGADHRSGNWFHMDVDAVHRCVAPNWDDDFQAMAISFGDVAQTEFISEAFYLDVDEKPKSSDYVKYAYINEGKPTSTPPVPWLTHSPLDGQVAHYTIRDFHRAGPIKKDGWRLIVLAFQTNTPPVEKWT